MNAYEPPEISDIPLDRTIPSGHRVRHKNRRPATGRDVTEEPPQGRRRRVARYAIPAIVATSTLVGAIVITDGLAAPSRRAAHCATTGLAPTLDTVSLRERISRPSTSVQQPGAWGPRHPYHLSRVSIDIDGSVYFEERGFIHKIDVLGTETVISPIGFAYASGAVIDPNGDTYVSTYLGFQFISEDSEDTAELFKLDGDRLGTTGPVSDAPDAIKWLLGASKRGLFEGSRDWDGQYSSAHGYDCNGVRYRLVPSTRYPWNRTWMVEVDQSGQTRPVEGNPRAEDLFEMWNVLRERGPVVVSGWMSAGTSGL